MEWTDQEVLSSAVDRGEHQSEIESPPVGEASIWSWSTTYSTIIRSRSQSCTSVDKDDCDHATAHPPYADGDEAKQEAA